MAEVSEREIFESMPVHKAVAALAVPTIIARLSVSSIIWLILFYRAVREALYGGGSHFGLSMVQCAYGSWQSFGIGGNFLYFHAVSRRRFLTFRSR